MRLKLNNKIGIDLSKLIESRLLVQANSGGGKSWAIRRIIEQAFGHVQIIVLDPEGEFPNLREKYDFVFAGKGGDAPAEKGVSKANVPEYPLTREELHSKVLSVLDGPQQRILKPLLEANGESIANDELAAMAGYQIGGGFNNPKGRLRSLGLIEYLRGNRIRARDILFI